MITRSKLFLFFIAVLFVCGGLTDLVGQEPVPTDSSRIEGQRGRPRPNIMSELDLSAEQMDQIKRLNSERRPLMRDAARRLREANRLLDEAIYADSANEAEIQIRLAAYQAAQAEVSKLRFTNELAVRNLLTLEQLVRFRDIRKRFAEQRQIRRKNGDEPRRRLRRSGRKPRAQPVPNSN